MNSNSQFFPTKVIEPSGGWRIPDPRELWKYRELLSVLVSRDVKVRYKQSVLGIAWVVLRPLASMVIFTFVFGKLAAIPSDGYAYAPFVLSGLLPWFYFSGAVLSAGGSLVTSAGLVSKVAFPRLVIPVAAVAGGLPDLLVSIGFLLAVMPFFHIAWTVNLLAVPFLVVAITVTSLGIGVLISALTVSYRDFGPIAAFVVQLWMFVTPIVYPASLVPPRWRLVMLANPLAAQVEGFRSAFLGKPFDLPSIAVSFLLSLILLLIGAAYFGRVERRFADIL